MVVIDDSMKVKLLETATVDNPGPQDSQTCNLFLFSK
jgi:hypothetical protein